MTMHENDSRSRLARRELLRLFGGAAGLAAVSALKTDADLFAAPLQRTTGAPLRFQKGAIVRTLLKDVPPDDLANGVTLFHEHLSINLASLGGGGRGRNGEPPPPPITDDLELMVALVKKAAADGVGCIVDGGHPDMGRKIDDLKTIATRTNVHVVASGGYYMQRRYPADIARKSENEIADALVREAREQRLGAFGEIGENPDGAELTLEERKVFRAVGKAQARTGIPVFTHNSYGTGPHVPKDIGLQQLDLLESAGASPDHIAIGHTCCLDDPDVTIIKEIAKRGAFVGFDRVTTVQQIMPDEKKVAMVMAFLDAGYAHKLLLCADFTGQRTLEGGPGYGRTVTVFAPLLRKAGIKEDTLHSILYDNPRRFLAFVPKKA